MKNLCIVGYGAIGPIHAKAIEETAGVKFYAVCDNNPDRIEKCKKDYDVKAYLDFDEMLLDENIDSVHICTPHYLHFEMIKKSLAYGKTVVCEKPVAQHTFCHKQLCSTVLSRSSDLLLVCFPYYI